MGGMRVSAQHVLRVRWPGGCPSTEGVPLSHNPIAEDGLAA